MTTEIRKKALKQHLQNKIHLTDIELINKEDHRFKIVTDSTEYLVLTDKEADKLCKESILNSLWAFNKDFIIEHSSILDSDETSKKLVGCIQAQYDDSNDVLLKLIDDIDVFIEDAIKEDSREHFICTYDGVENKETITYKDGYQTLFIYRTN